MKPYYEHAGITIYHTDCRVLISDPVVACAAAVVTDPPYGQTSCAWDKWVPEWLWQLTVPSLWCFGSLRMFMDHADEFLRPGWKLSQDVIWEKHNGSSFHADRFKRVHEQPAHFYRGSWDEIYKAPVTTADATTRTVRRKKRPPHTGHIEASAYESFDGGPRLMRSVLRVRSTHGYAEHETQKPLGIIAPLIEYSVPVGATVVDLFAGSGTTGLAARFLGRRAILIDVREECCEVAAKRLMQTLPLTLAEVGVRSAPETKE